MDNRLTGRWGESLAADSYRKQGYRVVSMGYRTRFGEIDLICQKGEYIVFAEVKLRKSDAFAKAREFVDLPKQQRLLRTAALYLQEHDEGLQPRFDVVEIYAPQGVDTKNPQVTVLEDAFGDTGSF